MLLKFSKEIIQKFLKIVTRLQKTFKISLGTQKNIQKVFQGNILQDCEKLLKISLGTQKNIQKFSKEIKYRLQKNIQKFCRNIPTRLRKTFLKISLEKYSMDSKIFFGKTSTRLRKVCKTNCHYNLFFKFF